MLGNVGRQDGLFQPKDLADNAGAVRGCVALLPARNY
jgi:hypothetical protein